MTISCSAPSSLSWAGMVANNNHSVPASTDTRSRTNSWAQVVQESDYSQSPPSSPSIESTASSETTFNIHAAWFTPIPSSIQPPLASPSKASLSIGSAEFIPSSGNTRPRSATSDPANARSMTVYADCAPSEKKHADTLAFQGRLSVLGTFNTSSQFESRFNDKLEKLPQGLALRVFRQGIQPLWEDAQNSGRGAGKWILIGGTKPAMRAAFRSILQKMCADQLPGVNGAVSVRKRGQDVVMLWTRAPYGQETNLIDPFGIQLLTADLSSEVSTPLEAGFKTHGKFGKKIVCKKYQAIDSDYELSPDLHPTDEQLEPISLSLAQSVQEAPIKQSWSMVVDKPRPRAMSWAQRAMIVEAAK